MEVTRSYRFLGSHDTDAHGFFRGQRDLSTEDFVRAITGRPSPADTAVFVAAITDRPNPDRTAMKALVKLLTNDQTPASRAALGAIIFREQYNPNEPRDWRGRWTTGGAGGSSTGVSYDAPATSTGDAAGDTRVSYPTSAPPTSPGQSGKSSTSGTSPASHGPPPPSYEPKRWNDNGVVQRSNNCYSYALDVPYEANGKPRPMDTKPQPGEAAGKPVQPDASGTFAKDLNPRCVERQIWGEGASQGR